MQKCRKSTMKGKNIFTYKYLHSWQKGERILEKDIKQEFEAIKSFLVFQERSVMQNTRFL